MAAVLLRKRITKLWSRLDAGTQAQLKQILLDALLQEQMYILPLHQLGLVIGLLILPLDP